MFALTKLRERPKVPLLSYIPPPTSKISLGRSAEEESYSMYPFVPHASLPWTMGDSSVFRIRKLSDWLTQNSTVGAIGADSLNSGSVTNALQWVVTPFVQITHSSLSFQGVY